MRVLISDFGGVLTTPLEAAIAACFERSGVALEDLGLALAAATESAGANPLFELECGRLTEAEFNAVLGEALAQRLGRPVGMDRFGEELFAGIAPNAELIAHLHTVRGRGHRMAICTNNVREWSVRWQAMVPVDALFETIVDSSEVGARKPDPIIYRETLRRMDVAAADAVFLDDLEINCAAATELGMHAIRFTTTEEAIAELEAALHGAR